MLPTSMGKAVQKSVPVPDNGESPGRAAVAVARLKGDSLGSLSRDELQPEMARDTNADPRDV